MCGLSLIILLATFCIFLSLLPLSLSLCSDLQSKQEQQRNSLFLAAMHKKKKLASSRCFIFKFFTALKTRNNKATERSFKWNFIMPRRCHNECWRPLNISSLSRGLVGKFKTHALILGPSRDARLPTRGDFITLLIFFWLRSHLLSNHDITN
jgi:hypothetical protein